jgi:pimeloyl-ACP methyl ester carboxylesterase
MRQIPRLILIAASILALAPLPAAASDAPSPASPAELFFKPAEFTAAAVSPDGRYVGFIALTNGHTSLFKLEVKTGQLSGIFSAGEGDVDFFWWVGNERVLVSALGTEGRMYFSQDLNSTPPRPIPSLQGWHAQSIRVLRDDHDHVVAFYFWGEEYLAQIDLLTGRSSKVESFISITDHTVISANGELRAKLWSFAGKWHVAWRARAGAPWQTIENSAYAMPVFTPFGIASDDRHILVLAHDQGDTEAVMSLDPDTGQRTLLAQRPDRDPTQLIYQPPAAGPVGAGFNNFGPEEIMFFDPAAEHLAAMVRASLPAGLISRVTSSSDDGKVRVVEAWAPGGPSRFYLLDLARHHLSMLGDERPALAAAQLGVMHYFKYRTRDGVEESGYLLLPGGRPPRNLPLIVLPMLAVGEPVVLSSFYNAQNQFFASRGYAVAHFAVRGTRGFGTRFLQDGDFQLTGKIPQDYEDGVASLVAEGLVDPHRVALLGHDYGGLFALRTAAFSKSFHAVVAVNARWGETATSISWMSSSLAEIDVIVKQAGGTKAAYEIARQFTPETFVSQLSTPALLVYPHIDLRSAFKQHHRIHEVYDPEAKELPDHETYEAGQVRLLGRIADFLDKTFK